MYHMRSCTAAEWSAWAVTPQDDGTTAPATAQDLLNRGVVVAHVDASSGDVFYHAGKLAAPQPGEFPGVALTPMEGPDAYLSRRYRALPAEHRARFHVARVFRSTDGTNLREACGAAVAASLSARTPATGLTSSKPTDQMGALLVLEEARRRAEMDPPTARALTLPMWDVRTGDVVVEDAIPGHSWQGETA